jgi:hypothetical protein
MRESWRACGLLKAYMLAKITNEASSNIKKRIGPFLKGISWLSLLRTDFVNMRIIFVEQ